MKAAILVMVLGLAVVPMTGCAAGVDDPVPPPPVQEEQRPPPKEPLSTRLRDPQAIIVAGMGIDRGLDDVDLPAKPPTPFPDPEDK